MTIGILGRTIPAKRYAARGIGCISGTSLTMSELSEKKNEEPTAIIMPECGSVRLGSLLLSDDPDVGDSGSNVSEL